MRGGECALIGFLISDHSRLFAFGGEGVPRGFGRTGSDRLAA